MLRLLLERAARQNEQLLELQREHAHRAEQSTPAFDVVALTRRPRYESFDDEDEPPERNVARVEHALERRRRELIADHALPKDLEALLRAIDARVADLGEVEGSALSDAALDLGVLALSLAGLREHGSE